MDVVTWVIVSESTIIHDYNFDFSFHQNGYDGGARFDGIAQPVIPPTPPGVPPTAAQLAAMAGHNVALTQKKGTYLTGSSDGGYTFW